MKISTSSFKMHAAGNTRLVQLAITFSDLAAVSRQASTRAQCCAAMFQMQLSPLLMLHANTAFSNDRTAAYIMHWLCHTLTIKGATSNAQDLDLAMLLFSRQSACHWLPYKGVAAMLRQAQRGW